MGEALSISAQAAATAGRLRLFQITFADEPPAQRRRLLDEEIKRSLGRVVPERRGEFLAELSDRFPTLGGDDAPPEAPDPLAIADQLAAMAPSLSPEQLRAVAERLKAAGLFGPPPTAVWPDAAADEAKAVLQINANERLDPIRALQLLKRLVALIVRLDEVTWNLWSQIDPEGHIGRRSPLLKTMSAFCRGGEPAKVNLEQDSEKLLALNSSIIASLPRVATPLFRRVLWNLLPPQIKEGTSASPMSMVRGNEKAWWRTYEERSSALNESTFEGALFGEVAEKTRQIMPPEFVR